MSVLQHYLLWLAGLAKPQTQTTEAERDCLTRHAASRRRLAEIGVWHGVTTLRLRQAMANDGILWAVDPFPAGRLGFSYQQHIAHRTVALSNNGEIRWVRTTGVEAARQFSAQEPVDFLFIDGDHSYDGLKGDWESWANLLAEGGIVGLHDSRPTPTRDIATAGSVRYTNEVILHDPRFELVEQVDSLTILRRITT